jgi:hypothetical protein
MEGKVILKHALPEITGSILTTGFTLLWACNPSGEILTTGKSRKKKMDRLFVEENTEKCIIG